MQYRLEVRPLVVPTIAIAIIGAASVMLSKIEDLPLPLGLFVFVCGSVYLASLPFGLEFHHRTYGMLLSQPVNRRVLWWRKMALILGLQLLIGVGFWFALPFENAMSSGGRRGEEVGFGLLWLAMTFSSACFWTLGARSVIGGTVFSMAGQFLAVLVVHLVFGKLESSFAAVQAPTPAAILLLINYGQGISYSLYCVAMVWFS